MPRGSQIGERRGGRQRGTPNRRTLLVERILTIAAERSGASASAFIDFLVKDQKLPANIRVAVARALLVAGAPQSRKARTTAARKRKAGPSGPRQKTSQAVTSAALGRLFVIAQDTTVDAEQRRKAASEAAQLLLPKRPSLRRWWVNAPVDDFGFAIRPEIAAEYRDTKMELRRLERQGADSRAARHKVARLRGRSKEILHRLQCPPPSRYGIEQWRKDCYRVGHLSLMRANKNFLREEAEAEEAHLTARIDAFLGEPEREALRRFSELQAKERIAKAAGRPLPERDEADLRRLRLIYSRGTPARTEFDEIAFRAVGDETVAADDNLNPSDSKLAPAKDIPPDVPGHPG